jgi:endonuclease G, mitochondrial
LTRTCETVYIVSGPLFLPRRREGTHSGSGSGNPASRAQWAMGYELIGQSPTDLVAVPTHFFKIVLAERRGDGGQQQQQQRRLVAAFVLPNAPIPPEMPLSNFLVPLDNLERVAGLRFFAQAISESHREMLDARVPLLRGSNANPHVAGLLTAGPSSNGDKGGGRGRGGAGGLRVQLDAPEHLCDVLACQLPPENFWQKQLPNAIGDGQQQQQQRGGRGRRGKGAGRAEDDGSGSPQEDAPPPVTKSSSWW